ncbi:hypothetical protein [Kitasatospora sp. P5_F3]
MSSPYEFRPTHVVPEGGLPTWESADPAHPSARLDPLLPVMLTEATGDWARVVCSNAWSAWVDGRMLITLPHRPPGTAQPLATTADPRALLARLEDALAAYRQLVDEYAAGLLDLEGFRSRSAGLRVGAVIDGPAAWLLDLDQGRWYYCEGAQLQTYATVEPADTGRGTP